MYGVDLFTLAEVVVWALVIGVIGGLLLVLLKLVVHLRWLRRQRRRTSWPR
jgi:hypothetical protein